MGKNNALIAANKELARIRKDYDDMLLEKIKDIQAQMYFAFALALHEDFHWKRDKIEKLFMRTQQWWEANAEDTESMCKWCEEELGIEISVRDKQ